MIIVLTSHERGSGAGTEQTGPPPKMRSAGKDEQDVTPKAAAPSRIETVGVVVVLDVVSIAR